MIDTEILDDYSNEARELLDEMDNSLIRLEKEGQSPEVLNNIFRAVHCIKGSAEYIGLERSSTLTHGVENLLDRVREGLIALDARMMDFLFRAKDTIATLIREVSSSREEKTEISGLLGELEEFLSGRAKSEPLPPFTEAAGSSVAPVETVETTFEADASSPPPAEPSGLGIEGNADTPESPEEPFEVEDDSESRTVTAEFPPYETSEAFTEEISREALDTSLLATEQTIPLTSETVMAGEEETLSASVLEEVAAPSHEPTAENVARLEQTAPQILNVALYLDDLQDGINPQDVVGPLSESLESLIRSMQSLGLMEAVRVLETMSSRLDAIDPERETFTPGQIAELRGCLEDLRSYYPEGFFPLEPTAVREAETPTQPEAPATTESYKNHPLYKELVRVPGVHHSLAVAILEFGFTSREQLARTDTATLLRIGEMTPTTAKKVLQAVGVGPVTTSGQVTPHPKAEARSLLADVDDELLREFEGIFAGGETAEIPLAGESRMDSLASDLLGELDTLGDDADREILEIFLAYGWEIMDKLRQVVEAIRPGRIRRSDLQACADLIKSIRSSSTYMDFQSLAAFLDEWYEKTIWAAEKSDSLTMADCRFMEENRLRFEDFLAGLDAVLNPGAVPVKRPAAMKSTPPRVAGNQSPSVPAKEPILDRSSPRSGVEAATTTEPVPTDEVPTVEIPTAEKEPPPTEELLHPPMGRVTDMAAPRDLSPESAVVRTMRVDSAKVDVLLNQVGELVVNRSYVEQLSLELRNLHRELQSVTQVGKKELVTVKNLSLKVGEASLALGRVANDIQEGVMKLRMLPIGQLFNRMPRLIRDLSRRVGKSVALQVHGGDTEVDKRVIEQIYNPLVHLIRNAVDHGIEDPATRRSQGKKEEGMVVLSAYSQGNQVVVDVEDDGAGINAAAVVEKAVQNRLIDEEDAKKLGPLEVYNFLFVPGFSTSNRVTRTSGRGVGMDVVKKDVEKINGHVEVSSEEGSGTRISIKIPLTLAIIQTLLIRVGKHMFAVPLTSVREILLISPGDISTIEGFEVIKFREETIPILRVHEVFNLKDHDTTREPKFLVLATAGLKTVGLLVEELIGEQDVVIKPLAEHVFESRGLAGSTILGDGTIALVLDVTEMIEDVIAQQRQVAVLGGRATPSARLMGLNHGFKA